MGSKLPTVSQAIDQSPLTRRHLTIFGVCMLLAMLDGWDTQSIGIVAPRLAGELALNDTQLGATFSSAQLGAAIGALLFGWLADRFGRRPLMACAAAMVAVFTTLTAWVHGYADLLVVRFAAGVGLGGAIPCALALASEYAPARVRGMVVTIVFAGYPVGAAIGGLINAWLVAGADWRTVFYVGGVLPALTVVALLMAVPESLQFLHARGLITRLAATLERMGLQADPAEGEAGARGAMRGPAASVLRLFVAGMTMSTGLLLAVYLFSYAQTKVVSAWFPSLLHSGGLSLSMGAIALSVVNVGSAIATASSGGLIDRFGPAPVLVPALGASAASLVLFAFFPAGAIAMYGLSAVVGVGCGIGTAGAHALAVRAFPSAVRSQRAGTGVGGRPLRPGHLAADAGHTADRRGIAMGDLRRDRCTAGCGRAGSGAPGREYLASAPWTRRPSAAAERRSSVMTHGAPHATIRRAAMDDAATLAGLGAATFTETFGHLYPPEDLHAFLVGSHSVDAWTRALSQHAVWLAALTDNTPVGFIVVGACKLPIENREPAAGEIHQLYVLARHHNLRLGSQLMDVGLAWLESRGRAPLYVGVWSENFGAQRFYRRYGFDKVGEYGFPVGKSVDREFILRR